MRPWVKLWTEIVDDPKMARLPDRLWRRVGEMFAFAGKVDDGGLLPPVADMAWTLHLTPDELTEDLLALSRLDRPIVICEDGRGWIVLKFVKRQAPMTDAERQRWHRDKECHDGVTARDTGCHENVTHTEQNRTDPDPEQEQDQPAGSAAVVVEALAGVLDEQSILDDLPHWPHPEAAGAVLRYARCTKGIKSIPAFVRAKMRKGWTPPRDNCGPEEPDEPDEPPKEVGEPPGDVVPDWPASMQTCLDPSTYKAHFKPSTARFVEGNIVVTLPSASVAIVEHRLRGVIDGVLAKHGRPIILEALS